MIDRIADISEEHEATLVALVRATALVGLDGDQRRWIAAVLHTRPWEAAITDTYEPHGGDTTFYAQSWPKSRTLRAEVFALAGVADPLATGAGA